MSPVLRVSLALAIVSSALGAGTPKNEAQDVSIIRLIAAPERFAGKLVRVIGYLNIEFEGDAIYLHEEDFRRSLCMNSLFVHADDDMMTELKRLSGHYVLIEGIFDPSQTGHMGLSSGGVTKINRADAWTPRPIPAGP
jgi:hypothetical protein